MTEIRLYNTRTRTKERFVPIDPANVRMYVCGPTVYDRAHIGNARPVVVFDVLYRLLRHVYGAGAVTYVRNFTDVDDKIIARAVATRGAGETLEAATRRITDETIGWYHDDMDALGALRPDFEPRCTDPEMIAAMVAMIGTLIEKGHAYEAGGHVLFAVDSWRERYGALSRRSVDDMIAGARVEVAPYKKNPMDFVLWKPSTLEQPGWDSPWGRGRPGWHIECSAMAREILGEVFDIHAGGIDLAFPHHENEVAQSCCAHGTERMANWWMHNEMLRVEGEKMSKSLGNFFTVRDLLDRRRGISDVGRAIRFLLLSTHYRQPLDWTEVRYREAISTLMKWRRFVEDAGVEVPTGEVSSELIDSLADDLNTAKAISILHGHISGSGEFDDVEHAQRLLNDLEFLGLNPMAMTLAEPEGPPAKVADQINRLLAMRSAARSNKDFVRADALRDGIAEAGVSVKDTPEGAEWELTPDFDPSKLEALK